MLVRKIRQIQRNGGDDSQKGTSALIIVGKNLDFVLMKEDV